MALDQIPPWISVGPTDYLHAVQAGGAAGLGIAEAQNRAREAAARTAEAQRAAAQQQWEFGERMRQAAEEHASQRELESAKLAQTGEYNKGMLGYHLGSLGEQTAHNTAMEEISQQRADEMLHSGEGSLIEFPELPGEKFVRQFDGRLAHVPHEKSGITPGQALNVITDPLHYSMAQGALGDDATNLVSIARSGILTRQKPQGGLSQGIPALPDLGDREYPKEVIHPLKNGRMAVFDPDTKEFLRYAD